MRKLPLVLGAAIAFATIAIPVQASQLSSYYDRPYYGYDDYYRYSRPYSSRNYYYDHHHYRPRYTDHYHRPHYRGHHHYRPQRTLRHVHRHYHHHHHRHHHYDDEFE